MIDRGGDFRRILITGAAGSGGRYLAEYIEEHYPDRSIHGAFRRISRRDVGPVHYPHEVNLLDTSSIIECLRKSLPDVVFHLAADADVLASFHTPSAVLHNNIVGTSNLLEAIRLERINPVFVMCSSSEVYGDVLPSEAPIKENCPMRPMSPYAVSKVAQDLLASVYFKAYQMRIIITRTFSYLNMHRSDLFTSHFAQQIALIEAGKLKELCHGNLDSVQAILDAKDVMRGYWMAACRGRYGEAYNIGVAEVTSVRDVLARLIKMSSVPIPNVVNHRLLRPADVTLQIPDCSKFQRETGWKPPLDLDESLKELLNYWREKVKNDPD